MSSCIGLIGDRCTDEPGANTMTIVSCQLREQKIWDDYVNDWYGEALERLKDERDAAATLKTAQLAWIQYRHAKCGDCEKRYEGGTFASVAAHERNRRWIGPGSSLAESCRRSTRRTWTSGLSRTAEKIDERVTGSVSSGACVACGAITSSSPLSRMQSRWRV
jgi:uncharacterized protein YecT (DUF1311 family)